MEKGVEMKQEDAVCEPDEKVDREKEEGRKRGRERGGRKIERGRDR